MRRILKRVLVRDPSGRPITQNAERFQDDGSGRVVHIAHRTLIRCQGCQHLVEDASDLRGRCDYCRTRGCCIHCETRCQGCSRRLCWACRRGFAGPTLMTLCPVCLVKMQRRQAFLDYEMRTQAVFQRRLLARRELIRVQALRAQVARTREMGFLHAARLRTNSQLQAARIRQAGQIAVMREMNRLRLTLANLIYRGRYR